MSWRGGSGFPGDITRNVTLQGNLNATALGAAPGTATANVTLAGNGRHCGAGAEQYSA